MLDYTSGRPALTAETCLETSLDFGRRQSLHMYSTAMQCEGVPNHVPLLLQIVGNGYDNEMFYTDSRVKQAYKNYVYMLLTRTNSYTGVQYKNDPTIFSVELMVWPHQCLFTSVKLGFVFDAAFLGAAEGFH